ncbi:MAG TPA: EAL domain-containing protein [Beijerinckiaceae bacterium]
MSISEKRDGLPNLGPQSAAAGTGRYGRALGLLGSAVAGLIIAVAVVGLDRLTGIGSMLFGGTRDLATFRMLPADFLFGLFGVAVFGLLGLGFGAAMLFRGRATAAAREVRNLESLLNYLDEAVVVCRGLQVTAATASFERLTGLSTQAATHRLLTDLLPDTVVVERILAADELRLETELRAVNGELIPVEIASRAVRDRGTDHLLEIRDVRERRASQAQIAFLAHHDGLTRLPNREVLNARLAAAIEACRQGGGRCGVVWIDLDRFKEVNDLLGHGSGDALLRQVSEKITLDLPPDTLVARVGGDEFVVLCPNLPDALEARLIGHQLRRLLNRPMEINGVTLPVGASIGVAVFPDDAGTAEELLRNADLALYQAKEQGRGKCRPFTRSLGEAFTRRQVLSEHLPAAIREGRIETHFQPILDVAGRRVAGFEALARWRHPEFGAVAAPEFVKIAEDSGLVPQLTDCVMRAALDEALRWPEDIRVSVNVSPVQISAEMVDQVRELLREKSFDPRRLELEVTEDAIINDFDEAASMFSRLRAIGVQVGMDDFGAGFTSLSNLRLLNFDRIKIDRVFTMDLPSHRRAGALVRAMMVLARELDIAVTVEGVETVEQYTFLRQLGCDEVQGFLFGASMPAPQIPAFLASRGWREAAAAPATYLDATVLRFPRTAVG